MDIITIINFIIAFGASIFSVSCAMGRNLPGRFVSCLLWASMALSSLAFALESMS